MIVRTLVTVLVALAASVSAPAARAAAVAPPTMPVAGSVGCRTPAAPPSTVLGREYRIRLPAGSGPHPLILVFHGAKQTARMIEDYTGFDGADAVVVYPQGRVVDADGHRGWSPNDDLPDAGPDIAYTRVLVAAVEQATCVDPARVYATGKSQGGGFAYTLACWAPDLVSAIAPVAAAVYRPGSHHGIDPSTCRSGPRRVLEFHGDADSVITYDGRTRAGEQARSRPVRTVGNDLGWVDEWVARDGCGGEDAPSAEPADVHIHHWGGCSDGSEVTHYRMLHAGHTWPGAAPGTSGGGNDVTNQSVDATAVILRFFDVS